MVFPTLTLKRKEEEGIQEEKGHKKRSNRDVNSLFDSSFFSRSLPV